MSSTATGKSPAETEAASGNRNNGLATTSAAGVAPPTTTTAHPPVPPPPQQRDPKELEAIKAAARAYALSGANNSASSKKRAAAKAKQAYRASLQQPRAFVQYPSPPGRLPKVTQHRTTIPAQSRTAKTAPPIPSMKQVPLPPPPHPPPVSYATKTLAMAPTPPPPPKVPTQNSHIHKRSVQMPPSPRIPIHNDRGSKLMTPTFSPPTQYLGRLAQLHPDDPEWQDYDRFVKSLWQDDESLHLPGDDDDDDDEDAEEFQLEEDEEEEEATERAPQTRSTRASQRTSIAENSMEQDLDLLSELGPNFYEELADELNWLEEEDMEAAVATLLEHPLTEPETPHKPSEDSRGTPAAKMMTPIALPSTPQARAAVSRIEVTQEQQDMLHDLMEKHYQLLLQQAILSVRTAHHQRLSRTARVTQPAKFYHSETADDLVEILDGAVGMLQDLDQNRKDAIRHFIQFEPGPQQQQPVSPGSSRRSLFAEADAANHDNEMEGLSERRLTRSQFTKTLQQQEQGQRRSVFEIRGLDRLNHTFNMIDKSVEGIRQAKVEEKKSILVVDSNEAACQEVLDQSGAVYDKNWLPAARDVSQNFTNPNEVLGKKFKPPCNEEQEMMLRRNRNLFSSGEDNLVLRGVNLYGEKQWLLLLNRFLPDRSVNLISQRHSTISVLLYKANGIEISETGELPKPPKLESVDDVDEEAAKKLMPVNPPAVLNVHRWSLDEDLTILKAVPVFGTMWAEIAARFLPHRDRGHIRKRYLVLERRIKATIAREKKQELVQKASAKKTPRATAKPRSIKSSSRKMALPAMHHSQVPRSPATKTPRAQSLPLLQHRPYPPVPFYPTQHHPPRQPYMGPMSPQLQLNPALASTRTLREEGSRAAFEQLVQESNNEWSQMSRMQQSETERAVANAIVTQLARSPAPARQGGYAAGQSSVPSDVLDDNSGDFSMLDSYRPSQAGTGSATGSATAGGLFAGVLQRAAQSQGGVGDTKSASAPPAPGLTSLSTVATTQSLMPPPSKAPESPEKRNSSSLTQEVAPSAYNSPNKNLASRSTQEVAPNVYNSPNKGKQMASSSSTQEVGPSIYNSPNKRQASSLTQEAPNIYNSPNKGQQVVQQGTPGRTSQQSSLPPFSPAAPSNFSPGSTLKSPSLTLATFPGGESSSHLFPPGGHSTDGVDLSGVFEYGASSKHSIDCSIKLDAPETPSPAKASPTSRYSSTPLFGEEATLMENDLEAISALNALSHSPAFLKLASGKDSSDSTSPTGKASRGGKSLFAKVVGSKAGAGEPDKKRRKLQF